MATHVEIARSRALVRAVRASHARTIELFAATVSSSSAIAACVRGSHYLRAATLARGGSDESLAETRERRCPHCRSESVRALSNVYSTDSFLKSLYRCDACDKQLLYVRRVLV
jgi:hypothetical protein